MVPEFIKSSILLRLLSKFSSTSSLFGKAFSAAYQESRTKNLLQAALQRIRNAFRYSCMGDAVILLDSDFCEFLNYSGFVKVFLKFRVAILERTSRYVHESLFLKKGQEIAKSIRLFPLRTAGFILVIFLLSSLLFLSLAAIAASSFKRFSFIKPGLSVFGWGVGGILLFLGIAAVSCDVPWQELRRTSVVFALSKKMSRT